MRLLTVDNDGFDGLCRSMKAKLCQHRLKQNTARAILLNQPLMNAELICIPSLAALSTRCLARSNFEFLRLSNGQKGSKMNRAMHTGRRTGPFTVRFLDRARSESSRQTFSRDGTLRPVRVILMRCVFCGRSVWNESRHKVLHEQAGR